MLIIPAIDIKNGKCVRLLQGDFNRVTVYGDDPVDMAKTWETKGAQRIHIVDLDGSRTGTPHSRNIIHAIARAVKVPVQVGGGIRDMQTVREYLEGGVSRVILGTAALKNRDLLIEACQAFPGSIILGIDARDGKVAVEGWLEGSERTPVELAGLYENQGIDAIIYTDIQRDGMKMGINLDATKHLAESVHTPVIASGGVSGIQDIENLLTIKDSGVIGVVIGKALYSGALDLSEAITVAQRR